MPAAAHARDDASRLLALCVGGLMALAAAMGIGRFVYTPILPLMVADLHLSASAAGLIASANFAGYLAGALLAATPLVHGPRRPWLLAALFASAASTLAMGLGETLPAFLLLRFAGGAASAVVMVFASTLVLGRLTAAGRGDLAAVHFSGVGAGIVVSAAAVSLLVAHGGGWRAAWIASGVLALLALVAVALLVPAGSEPQAAAPARPGAGRRGLPEMVIAYGLFGFGYVVTATFLVAIVRGDPQAQRIEPLVWIVVGAAAAPSVALWAAIARRVGNAPAFAGACVVQAAGVLASLLGGGVAGVLAAGVLLGGTIMGLTALGLMAAGELGTGDPRRVLATMTASFGTGQIVGPVVAGALHDATGSFLLPTLAAAAALLLGAVLALRVPG